MAIIYACDRCHLVVSPTANECVNIERKAFTGGIKVNHLCQECNVELDLWLSPGPGSPGIS